MKSQYKYTIVGTLPQFEKGRRIIRYQLMTIKNKKELFKVVGIGRLRTMYHEGHIEGHIAPYVKEKLGLERRKIRSDRIKPVKSYQMPVEKVAPVWNLKDLTIGWNIPDEWNVEKPNPFKNLFDDEA